MTPTRCAGCGLTSDGREVVCGVCWSGIPGEHRRKVHAAQKGLGYNPASQRAQAQLAQAIADALGAIR